MRPFVYFTLSRLSRLSPERGATQIVSTLSAQPILEDDGYPRDAVHGFIVDASSSFYAQFGELVHARVDEWLDAVVTAS
jgi:hypothetical protein